MPPSRQRILLVNQVFYPDVVSTAQHLTDFAVELAKRGCEVTVLTGQRGYSEPHPIFKSNELYEGVRVLRVWPFTFGRKSRIARILDALFLNLSFAWRLLWLGRFDKVIALTSPPLVGWIAMLYAKIRRSRFIYWVMDVNPDEALEAGWIRKGSLQAKLLNGILRQTVKGSDKIIVLDRFMKDRLVLKGADAAKIEVNPPWAHDEDLESIPHEKNPFRKQYSLDGKFVIMYSGNHSLCHPLDTLLEAALHSKDDPSVVFLFIGGGERVGDVRKFKEKHQLANMIQLPYLERAAIKYSLSAADLHVVVMGNAFVGIVHPCKIYGILAVGRPFVYLGPRQSAIGELIDDENVGWQADHGDTEALMKIIEQVRKLAVDKKNEIKDKSQAIMKIKYSKAILSKQLIESVLS